ncbi:MAG TPA: type III polyketide synthase [Candidatus Thermoplasmatota archaeon]|nr:type III polyketide synthase [Candidatus Thermoplasmatota archaeon]
MPVLESLGTAVPGPAIPQAEVRRRAEALLAPVAPELAAKMAVFESVGIRKRHFAMPVEWYLEPHGWGERSAAYREVGLDVLERAARQALERAGLPPSAVDGVVLVSTTGLSTPSLDARLANRMGLRSDATRVPVWGLGCAGGVAGLRLAADLARANPEKRYLLLAMELCSLSFNLNDLSVRAFVATTLFSDGAAAALVRGDDVEGGALARIGGAASHQWPGTEDVMGWDVLDEGLRVVFSRRIPDITATQLRPVVDAFLKREGVAPARHVFHPGGTKVLEAYESGLGLAPDALDTARAVLREYGNMSSPTVLFTLEESLRRAALAPGESALLAALGPGFTAELAMLHG